MLFTIPSLDARQQRAVDRIDLLRRDLRHRVAEPRRWTGSLRRLSFARAIQGSNSIEGYVAELDDVVAEAEGEDGLDTHSETRLALRGYREAMTLVLQVADDTFAYDEMLLRSLQFMMTSYDLSKRPGQWRAGAIFVRDDDRGEVVYEGPEVDVVPTLMAEFIAWLRDGDLNAPAIVRAAMAHLNLVMIHPFRDGNGRMARCLQTLVLAREGILAPQFCSIEEYLGRNTQAYYDVLAEVGGGHWQPERDATPWIEFTLLAHYRQAKTLLLRVREIEELWGVLEAEASQRGLPERVVPALYDAAIGLRVRNSTYRTAHEVELSENVASRDLKALVDADLLNPTGEKRGRYYTRAKHLAELYSKIRSRRESVEDDDPFAS